MNKMKKISIAWGILIVIVFGLLTYFALTWKNSTNEYKKLENTLVDSVKAYYESKYKYPTGMEVITVTLNELKENNILSELRYEDDLCDGYVDVAYDNVITYKAYIKCSNYVTKGYNDNQS